MTKTLTKAERYQVARKRFTSWSTEIVDRPTINEDLCGLIVQDLLNKGLAKTATIAIIDSTPNLALHLHEVGFTNLTYFYNSKAQFTTKQSAEWPTVVRGFCTNQAIKVVEYLPTTSNMKEFDAIVGNPPFKNPKHNCKTNNLWKLFVEMSTKQSPYTSLVLPGSMLGPVMYGKYKHLITHIDLDVKKYFPGVGSQFCRVTFDHDADSTATVNTAQGTLTIDKDSMIGVPLTLDADLLDWMNNHMKGGVNWQTSCEYEQRKPIWEEDGIYEVRHTSSHGIWRTNVYSPNNSKVRVSIDCSGHPTFRVIHNMGLTQAHVWTIVDSIEEAERLAAWGNSDEVQSYLRRCVKWSGMNYQRSLKTISF